MAGGSPLPQAAAAADEGRISLKLRSAHAGEKVMRMRREDPFSKLFAAYRCAAAAPAPQAAAAGGMRCAGLSRGCLLMQAPLWLSWPATGAAAAASPAHSPADIPACPDPLLCAGAGQRRRATSRARMPPCAFCLTATSWGRGRRLPAWSLRATSASTSTSD